MDWCSDVDAVLVCSGEVKAEHKGSTVDLLVNVHFYLLT